jgi:hypothetical protein
VLHGNTDDYLRIGDGEGARYGTLAEFLAEQMFGRWDLVLHYDLGAACACSPAARGGVAGDGHARQQKIGDVSAAVEGSRRDVRAASIRFVRANIMAAEADRLSLALIIDQASYLFPPASPAGSSLRRRRSW